MSMDSDTQQLIVKILGGLALVSLMEVGLILKFMPTIHMTIIIAMINIPSTIVGLLGGFIAGKTLTEKQSEELSNGDGVDTQFLDQPY